ncbi:F-box/FBD/LRR-repeat protein At1g16930-like [Spinacia oleracea]|uniref:F-box/FBD/LRR-repeat protein At1g16930-like n=1 Tax=Spinacia oleracea TaxID=3562 RepID=A0ABM3QZQ9_SPIOL|nr:F-box/FBD/LRR-repeat protein At1g16930-like [Spinacia oleracea]
MTEIRPTRKREDRLSSLPDALLIDIISLVPTDAAIATAIATAVLSPRWRFLWAHITSLDIDTRKFRLDAINQVINKITSPSIKTFKLRVCGRTFVKGRTFVYCRTVMHTYFSGVMDSSCRRICDRNIEEISLKIQDFNFDHILFQNPSCVFQIPSCVFQTLSLVLLELDSNIRGCCYGISDDIFEFFPFTVKVCKGWGKLIESLPSLEVLSMVVPLTKDRYFLDKPQIDISITSRNLVRLNLSVLGKELVNVVVDAPRLEYLRFDVLILSKFVFVKKPNSIREANISFDLEFTDDDDVDDDRNNWIMEFLGSISNVSSLTLCIRDDDVMITTAVLFANLTYLRLQMSNLYL